MSLEKRAHAFKSQNIAEALVEVGKREMAGKRGDKTPTGREVRIVKTPSTGIAAATLNAGEMELEFALCEIKLAGVALATPVTKSTNLTDGTTAAKLKVWNITATAIGGNEFITAVRVGSAWFAQAGSGGGGTDTAKTYQFKTTTSISAGNPVDGSVGTGSANLWVFNGGAFAIDSTALYDIINPWATTVSTDKMITAYQDASYPTNYILVQSECETTGGGGTDPPADPEGYCIDDTTGAVTSNVLQSACTGTWSSTLPTTGCCDISGTEHPDVAESWCTTQLGSFTAGACPPAFDACAENARFKVTAITFADPNPTGCATTAWSVTGLSGNALGSPATAARKLHTEVSPLHPARTRQRALVLLIAT